MELLDNSARLDSLFDKNSFICPQFFIIIFILVATGVAVTALIIGYVIYQSSSTETTLPASMPDDMFDVTVEDEL